MPCAGGRAACVSPVAAWEIQVVETGNKATGTIICSNCTYMYLYICWLHAALSAQCSWAHKAGTYMVLNRFKRGSCAS